MRKDGTYKSCLLFIFVVAFSFLTGCRNSKQEQAPSQHQEEIKKEIYTCPMHPQIIRDKPGNCPICGMQLVRKEEEGNKITGVKLESLLKPTNQFAVSAIPTVTIQKREEQVEIGALGNVAYDTRETGTISARTTGRIERLYVRYRYQKIVRGQKILDIYSPEVMTAEENLIFLIRNDPGNNSLINAAKERLLLLGVSGTQLQKLLQTQKPSFTISVYSNYSGHIHEAGSNPSMNTVTQGPMKDITLLTEELSLKEGMYLQKGQAIFTVFNPARAWALLNIYAGEQGLVKEGNAVRVVPETAPDKDFHAKIDFIEPFYRQDNKTLTVRVYFDNSFLQIPIGSQVRATIFGNTKEAWWLPNESVLSLGLDKIVFLKEDGGFRAHKINTGILHKDLIQVLKGLTANDSVALNAQYLMDSESFIKINE